MACRWDGLPGPDVILEQTYSKEHWRAHWNWLVKFFNHERYILVEGKPMLVMYRVHDVPAFEEMTIYWRQLAVQAGVRSYLATKLTIWRASMLCSS